jgi:aspartate aminotransferase
MAHTDALVRPWSEPQLFAGMALGEATRVDLAAGAVAAGHAADGAVVDDFVPGVDERLLDVYAHANDPSDPSELRDLYLGRVEHELGRASHRPELAERWLATRPRRAVSETDVLRSRATVRFVKELFNWFFRDDLYGSLRSDSHVILSSGSVDERTYGLPEVLKECVRYALTRDWYGYSDSRGRIPAREAVAAYESARADGVRYDAENVALTMGGTFAVSALADFVALARGGGGTALCAIPNYPPLVEAVARRMDVALVPLPCHAGTTSLEPLIEALTPSTPLVLLQTVTNPTGTVVDEPQLGRLIAAAAPSTLILLDECHECLGPLMTQSAARAATNVVRISSMSKTWSAPGLKLGWIVADSALIDEYYEYASTTFGGPPSFLYTLVEVMARMERWLIEGLNSLGPAEVKEFETSYGLTTDRLAYAYAGYRRDRIARETALTRLRDAAIAGIAGPSVAVVRPRYSINIAVTFAGWNDSYRCFREVLARAAVAVFPGILTLCLGGGTVRLTTARAWSDLNRAIVALNGVGGRGARRRTFPESFASTGADATGRRRARRE